MAPTAIVGTADAAVAPVGQGFNLNASDMRFIKADPDRGEPRGARPPDNPCGTQVGTGRTRSRREPVGTTLPWGLRTVDGSCNNLIPARAGDWGAADTVVPAAGSDGRAARSPTRTRGTVTDVGSRARSAT